MVRWAWLWNDWSVDSVLSRHTEGQTDAHFGSNWEAEQHGLKYGSYIRALKTLKQCGVKAKDYCNSFSVIKSPYYYYYLLICIICFLTLEIQYDIMFVCHELTCDFYYNWTDSSVTKPKTDMVSLNRYRAQLIQNTSIQFVVCIVTQH